MATPESQRPSWERLFDFVSGRLTPEESYRILDIAEQDEEVSREIEYLIDIINGLGDWEELEGNSPVIDGIASLD
jgi:hypothetical protein